MNAATATATSAKDGTRGAAGGAPATTEGGQASAGGLRQQLKGMSYAEGNRLLTPVQMNDDPKGGVGGGPGQGSVAKEIAAGSKVATKTVAGDKDAIAKAKLGKSIANFGVVDSMGAFQAAAGAFIEGLVPSPGMEVEASLKAAIKGGWGGIDIELKAGVKHTAAGYEVGGSVGLDLYVYAQRWGFEAKAGLRGKVSMNAKGDSCSECMTLMGLGIYNWLEPQDLKFMGEKEEVARLARELVGGPTKWVLNAIWGKDFVADTLKNMDDETKGDGADSIEMAASGGLTGGVGRESGKNKAAVGGEIGYEAKSTVTKGKDGKLKDTKSGKSEAKVGFQFETVMNGVAVKGKVERVWNLTAGTGEYAFEFAIGGKTSGELSGMVAIGGAAWAAYAGVINLALGYLKGNAPAAELVSLGSLAGAAPQAAFLGAIASGKVVLPKRFGSEFSFDFAGKWAEKAELVVCLAHEIKSEGELLGQKYEAGVKTKTELLKFESASAKT